MFLIVGLGNPGSRYGNTRHNAGFMLVDRLASRVGGSFGRNTRKSLTCKAEIQGRAVVLAKPQTFMNLSGGAVQELLRFYPVDLTRLLVVYDDVALDLGAIRIRRSGSAGGHKGMISIIESLGSQEFPRLRIGVGAETMIGRIKSFVLSDFRKSEEKELDETLEAAADAVEVILADGLERAMAKYN